jgi:hypothetical protein
VPSGDSFTLHTVSHTAPVTVMNYPAGLHAFEVEDNRPEPKEPANIAETERILRNTMHWLKERLSQRR